MKSKVNLKSVNREIFMGDRVYVKVRVRNELNYKLGPKFDGPYEVTENLVGNKYKVRSLETHTERVVHISQLKLVSSQEKKKKKVRFML